MNYLTVLGVCRSGDAPDVLPGYNRGRSTRPAKAGGAGMEEGVLHAIGVAIAPCTFSGGRSELELAGCHLHLSNASS
jgi:hypothetical protein